MRGWFVFTLVCAPEDHRGAGRIASHALGVAMRSAQDVHGSDERASAIEGDSGGLPWQGASQEDHPRILVLRFDGSPTDDPGLNGILVGRIGERRSFCGGPHHPSHPPEHPPGGDVGWPSLSLHPGRGVHVGPHRWSWLDRIFSRSAWKGKTIVHNTDLDLDLDISQVGRTCVSKRRMDVDLEGWGA
mmetsp:Transcript_2032/g.13086  ORF Transcript_2032/g.13086 Transcript_2032/m.13086 type:complete len:187 (+) Transcript_2032:3219-3779(+)